jgi:diaminopimelate epimerase
VEHARFTAIDGVHEGRWSQKEVAISLPAVLGVVRDEAIPGVDFIHTGSPHLLVWVDEVEAVDLLHDAPPMRRSVRFSKDGTNVNYVQPYEGGIRMRTYERGVEDETLSCGSGVVAAALSAMAKGASVAPVPVHTRGGRLAVEAAPTATGGFQDIRLVGPATYVYHGVIAI